MHFDCILLARGCLLSWTLTREHVILDWSVEVLFFFNSSLNFTRQSKTPNPKVCTPVICKRSVAKRVQSRFICHCSGFDDVVQQFIQSKRHSCDHPETKRKRKKNALGDFYVDIDSKLAKKNRQLWKTPDKQIIIKKKRKRQSN